MIENRYYIIDLTINIMISLKNIIVGNFQDLRTNNDKTLAIIKLKDGDTTNYTVLEPYTEYTHEEILIELQKPEWSNPLLII